MDCRACDWVPHHRLSMARAPRLQAKGSTGLGALDYAGSRVADRQSPCGRDPTVWSGRRRLYDGGWLH